MNTPATSPGLCQVCGESLYPSNLEGYVHVSRLGPRGPACMVEIWCPRSPEEIQARTEELLGESQSEANDSEDRSR